MWDPQVDTELQKIRFSLRSIAASLVARECRESGDTEGAEKFHKIARESIPAVT